MSRRESEDLLVFTAYAKSNALPFEDEGIIEDRAFRALSDVLRQLPTGKVLKAMLPLIQQHCEKDFLLAYISTFTKKELIEMKYLHTVDIKSSRQNTTTTAIQSTTTFPNKLNAVITTCKQQQRANSTIDPVAKIRKSTTIVADKEPNENRGSKLTITQATKLWQRDHQSLVKRWMSSAPFYPEICSKQKCLLCLTQFLSGIVSRCDQSCIHPSGPEMLYPHHSKNQLRRLAHLHAIRAKYAIVLWNPQEARRGCFGRLSAHCPIESFPKNIRPAITEWARECEIYVDEEWLIDSDDEKSDYTQDTSDGVRESALWVSETKHLHKKSDKRKATSRSSASGAPAAKR